MFDANMAALRADAQLEDFRFHDIRRTVSTRLAESGVEQNINSRILNHVARQTNGERFDPVAAVYNRAAYAMEKREAFDKWAAKLEEIVGCRLIEPTEPAKVIPLRRSAV
jgi:integrase